MQRGGDFGALKLFDVPTHTTYLSNICGGSFVCEKTTKK